MIDPGWAAAGAIVVVNIAGWVVNHNHSSKEEARREGKVIAQLGEYFRPKT